MTPEQNHAPQTNTTNTMLITFSERRATINNILAESWWKKHNNVYSFLYLLNSTDNVVNVHMFEKTKIYFTSWLWDVPVNVNEKSVFFSVFCSFTIIIIFSGRDLG